MLSSLCRLVSPICTLFSLANIYKVCFESIRLTVQQWGKDKSSTHGGCYSILVKEYNILGLALIARFPPRLLEAGISFI